MTGQRETRHIPAVVERLHTHSHRAEILADHLEVGKAAAVDLLLPDRLVITVVEDHVDRLAHEALRLGHVSLLERFIGRTDRVFHAAKRPQCHRCGHDLVNLLGDPLVVVGRRQALAFFGSCQHVL